MAERRVAREIHVAVAVIRHNDRILIARRADHVHQGGLWEFPGGKVEHGESVFNALVRECREELGIVVIKAEPLITVTHNYGDRVVTLDTYVVTEFKGTPSGMEGQPVKWADLRNLGEFSFPEADHGIINALSLPDKCAVTAEHHATVQPYLDDIRRYLANGLKLIYLRCPQLNAEQYRELARAAFQQSERAGARLMTNLRPGCQDAHGCHLKSSELRTVTPDVLRQYDLLSASCHNAEELEMAQELGVDFVFLSPVKPSVTHPVSACLGWETFQSLVQRTNIPVYALGGMTAKDLVHAREHGAQGIAGISIFLQDNQGR